MDKEEKKEGYLVHARLLQDVVYAGPNALQGAFFMRDLTGDLRPGSD